MGNKQHNCGSIVVRTHQPYYYAGDTVSGTVYLDLVDKFPGKKINLKIKGKEKCKFVTSHIEHEEEVEKTVFTDRFGKTVCYRHKLPLFKSHEDEIEPGQYQFPFTMKLKEDIPSTYNNSGDDWYAKVYYKLIVSLENKEDEDLSLENDIPMIIRPKPVPEEDEESEKYKKKISLFKFCCLSAGELKVKAKFDKDSYTPGEEAYVKVKLKNEEGQVPIDGIELSLVNEINMKSKCGHSKRIVKILKTESFEGIGAGEDTPDDEPRKIRMDLVAPGKTMEPSTDGEFVKSDYFLKLRFLASGCACIYNGTISQDILMHAELPKESNFYTYTQPPEGWNPKNMEEVDLVATDEFAEPSKKEKKEGKGKKYKQPETMAEPSEE